MEHKTYIARKHARFDAVCGPVNIPYGTPLQVEGDFLCLDGKLLCYPESQTSLDFFSQNDDGNGLQREAGGGCSFPAGKAGQQPPEAVEQGLG